MEVTEVRIKLLEIAGERLQAFCSITLDDCFVIRDLKIIDGGTGPFVAMPSRKLTAHCPQCGCKNHLRAGYCNQCGTRLKEDRTIKDEDGRTKLYADIAHPIHAACREMIQNRVIRAFQEELERAKQPGYVSSYDDIDPDDCVAHSFNGPKPARRDAPLPRDAAPRHPAPRESITPPPPATQSIKPRPPHRMSDAAPHGADPRRGRNDERRSHANRRKPPHAIRRLRGKEFFRRTGRSGR